MILRRLPFTLLEVMVALSLLLFAGGVFGWKMHQMIAKKRFTSSVEKLQSRLLTCRFLAMNMQTDWKGSLYCQGGSWKFESSAVDDSFASKIPSLSLELSEVSWNGEKKKEYVFDFSATGDVIPAGRLDIYGASGSVQWTFPELFSLEEGKKNGPMHPDELPDAAQNLSQIQR